MSTISLASLTTPRVDGTEHDTPIGSSALALVPVLLACALLAGTAVPLGMPMMAVAAGLLASAATATFVFRTIRAAL